MSTWRDALRPHAEVSGRPEGVRDHGHIDYAPRRLTVQAFLANGKLAQVT